MQVAALVLLILLLLLLTAFGNFLHYSIKTFLRSTGVQVSFWRNDPINVANLLRNLIAAEQDLRMKRQYQEVLYLYIASIALFLGVGLLLMFASR